MLFLPTQRIAHRFHLPLYRCPSFRFYEDGLRFVGILALLALVGFIYTIVVLHRRGAPIGKILIRGLDLTTTVRCE